MFRVVLQRTHGLQRGQRQERPGTAVLVGHDPVGGAAVVAVLASYTSCLLDRDNRCSGSVGGCEEN